MGTNGEHNPIPTMANLSLEITSLPQFPLLPTDIRKHIYSFVPPKTGFGLCKESWQLFSDILSEVVRTHIKEIHLVHPELVSFRALKGKRFSLTGVPIKARLIIWNKFGHNTKDRVSYIVTLPKLIFTYERRYQARFGF